MNINSLIPSGIYSVYPFDKIANNSTPSLLNNGTVIPVKFNLTWTWSIDIANTHARIVLSPALLQGANALQMNSAVLTLCGLGSDDDLDFRLYTGYNLSDTSLGGWADMLGNPEIAVDMSHVPINERAILGRRGEFNNPAVYPSTTMNWRSCFSMEATTALVAPQQIELPTNIIIANNATAASDTEIYANQLIIEVIRASTPSEAQVSANINVTVF